MYDGGQGEMAQARCQRQHSTNDQTSADAKEYPVRQSPARIFARLGAPAPPEQPPIVIGRAIVLGGSVAGLLAARVLAEHAESVVILDRDEPESDAGSRARVPQSAQVHALLPAGRVQLDRWFPGFSDQAVAEGACLAPAAIRRTYIDGRRKVPGSEVELLTASRPFLEGLIRRRTLELPNVKTVSGRATGLVFRDAAVVGVHAETSGGHAIEAADFVVDAMGRASRLSDWLAQAGWERPPMRRMTININYATALFRRAEKKPALNAVLSLCSPAISPEVAGAVFSAIEQDRWMVMLGGYGDSRPGHTAEDFVRRCREAFPPEFGRVVDNEMLGDVNTYRQADSRRRDFYLVKRFPAGLVSVGDAVASFNPIYGQGMSSAALHASCLSMYLRANPDLSAPAREFFALQRIVVDAAWATSTSADLALPHVNGPYPRGYRLSNWMSGQIIAASVTDSTIARQFDEVTFMLRHPSSLARPGTLLHALRANWRDRADAVRAAR
jgi:2-polyprenyl-6-methoxyphenol hydroxylase-like FAD-dependent oxidoreductase